MAKASANGDTDDADEEMDEIALDAPPRADGEDDAGSEGDMEDMEVTLSPPISITQTGNLK